MKINYYKLRTSTLLLAVTLTGFTLASAVSIPTSSEVTGTLSTGLGNSSVTGIVIAAPVATPGTGTYTSTQTVALAAAGSLSIHYTVDGTTATCTTGSTYSAPITVASSQTISAISCYANSISGGVSSHVYTISTVVSGGGGGGGGGIIDTTPPTNTSISINSGAASTASLSVRLTLAATDAAFMIISNDAGFAQAEWETYTVSKSWTLVSGDGVKTVYVKFRDSSNNMSMAVSDTILVSGSLTVAPLVTGTIPTQGCSGGNKFNTSTGALCVNNGTPRGQVLGATAIMFNRDLRIGSRGEDVKELQKILIAGGFMNGEATGYFGPLTSVALRKWQVKNGLTVSQTFGNASRDFLNAAQSGNTQTPEKKKVVIFTKDLRLGNRNNDVTELQKILIAEKFLNVLSPTNYFGIMTQTALKKWQAKNGLQTTGYLDAASRAFLKTQ